MSELNDHGARAHALLSASSSARWLACPPSAVIAARYPNVSTPFTREGTVAHEVAEVIASGGKVAVDGEITEEMVHCAEEYRDYIQGLCKPDTVMLLEQRLDMTPWVPGGFGTGDCILLTGDVMDVVDYKYGQGVPVSAEANSQLMLYGLGAMNEYGFVYEAKTVRLHIFQPRISNVSVYELPASDLLNCGEGVKVIAADAAEGGGVLSAGEHCRFCPHAGRCPELAYKVIYSWLKKLKERALADMLDGQEIPGFKVVEGKQGNRKWKDEFAVAAALEAAGYSKDEYTTVSLLSPAAMDKALGKKCAADLLAGMVDRSPGAPTVVPSSDKRAPYVRVSDSDFEEI